MQLGYLILLVAFFEIIPLNWEGVDNPWTIEKNKEYDLYYTHADKKNLITYKNLVDNGIKSVKFFFNSDYSEKFNIFVHPDRHSLDSTWQRDWKLPNFRSECWMVASGVASRLDLISPEVWEKESCEHSASNTQATGQIITHELIHVYHGQKNQSHDFSDAVGIDWFVEGLATYASGQCDSLRMIEIKKAVSDNTIPKSLDEFWTGKLKYGLSGSVVMFIDKKYGRAKLIQLLKFSKKTEILSFLNIGEQDLINKWEAYITGV